MGFSKVALAGLALAILIAPVAAQEKTKEKAGAGPALDATGVLTEARTLCDRIAGGDEDVLDTLNQQGWEPELDPFGEIPFYHEIEGSRDYAGFGRADIWGFVELYPSHMIGYCTFEIVAPEVRIPVEELNSMEGLTGGVEYSDGGVYTSLTNDFGPRHLMVQARMTQDSFLYQVTDIIPRD